MSTWFTDIISWTPHVRKVAQLKHCAASFDQHAGAGN